MFVCKINFSDVIDDSYGFGLCCMFGFWGIMVLGIGVVIGIGIFVVIGIVVVEYVGLVVLIFFILVVICSVFSVLCYVEFVMFILVFGSFYFYVYVMLGELVVWFIGWNMVLEYGILVLVVVVSWIGYFISLFDYVGIYLFVLFIEVLLVFIGGYLVVMGYLFNLLVVVIVLVFIWFCYVGICELLGLNILMVLLKVGLILMIIIVGVCYVNIDNWYFFIFELKGDGEFGWFGIFCGVVMVFFVYIGFEVIFIVV